MADLDQGYADYYLKWKSRLKLKDIYLGEGYMRGEALDAAGYDNLPVDHSLTGIHVRVDGRGVDGQTDLASFPDMIAMWEGTLETQDTSDPRNLTKDFICQAVALNRHTDEDKAPMILCAAVWLASATPGALDALADSGAGLLVDFTFENGKRRMRASVLAA